MTGALLQIVAVTHYFPARKGGIEIVAHEINRRLAARGHQVHWFATASEPMPAAQPNLHCQPMQAIEWIEHLVGIPLPIWIGGGVPRLFSAIRQCDAVHVHDFIYPGSMLAMLFAYWHGKPVVLTQHIGDIPYNSRILALTLSAVNHLVGRLAMRSAAQVVFISNAVEAYFRGFIRFRRAPVYLPNGVNDALFYPVDAAARQQLRDQLGIGRDERVALFVGRFVEKKGMKLLGQVVPLTPSITWLFAGHGPLRAPQPVGQTVRVFDSLTHAELANLYRAADLLILPSQGEGFPLVVQEAFACGLPAMVSDATAAGCAQARHLLAELPVVGEAAARQWQAGLMAQFADPAALAARRSAVAAFAVQHWNWERAVETYEAMYRSRVAAAPA